jgi:hypothetical protein
MSKYVSKNGKVSILFRPGPIEILYNFYILEAAIEVENNVFSNFLESLLLFNDFHVEKIKIQFNDRLKISIYFDNKNIRIYYGSELDMNQAITILLDKINE